LFESNYNVRADLFFDESRAIDLSSTFQNKFFSRNYDRRAFAPRGHDAVAARHDRQPSWYRYKSIPGWKTQPMQGSRCVQMMVQ
jgi:hypothetical protein